MGSHGRPARRPTRAPPLLPRTGQGLLSPGPARLSLRLPRSCPHTPRWTLSLRSPGRVTLLAVSSRTCFLGLKQNRERKSKLCPLYFLFCLFSGGVGWQSQPRAHRPPGAERWGRGDTRNWGCSLREPLDLGVFHQKKGRCRRPTLLCRPSHDARHSPLEVVPRAHWWSWGPLPPSLLSRR